jgi:hypothetical protein
VLPRAAPIRIRSGNKIKRSAGKRLTLAGKIDILAAMIIGTLFIDDMGKLLMVVRPAPRTPNDEQYWECDDVMYGDGTFCWFKTDEVLAGQNLLDKLLLNSVE